MKLISFISLFVFIHHITTSQCAKILGVLHLPVRSHHIAFSSIMKILANKGHDVTIMSPIEDKIVQKNYKQIVLTGIFEDFQKSNLNMFDFQINPFKSLLLVDSISTEIIEKVFNHSKFQELMKSGATYDIVITQQLFTTDAMKYIAFNFNASCIVYNPVDANDWVNSYQGNPEWPSYIPNPFISCVTGKMSFFDRLYNSIIHLYGRMVKIWITIPMQNEMLHKYFPEAPKLTDFIYNVSLVLLNSDLSIYEAIPKVPSMINIGGFHLKEAKSLPEDLQEILDKANNGAVYFSMGSNLRSRDIPKEQRQFILRALSKLKQTVLWKFEDDELLEKPKNVIIRKWFPQNDILGHRNVKLFITHGGILSSMETIYHGVPLLALPVLDEQNANARRAEANGYAKVIPFRELTEEKFTEYLQELLTKAEYRMNVQKRSEIMKDRPMSAADTINYWVEYIVRHEGAPHLRVAALDLHWYQYLLLDVLAFILIAVSTFFFAMIRMYRYLVGRKRNTKSKTKVN